MSDTTETETIKYSYKDLSEEATRPAYMDISKHADFDDNGLLFISAPDVMHNVLVPKGKSIEVEYDPQRVAVTSYKVDGEDRVDERQGSGPADVVSQQRGMIPDPHAGPTGPTNEGHTPAPQNSSTGDTPEPQRESDKDDPTLQATSDFNREKALGIPGEQRAPDALVADAPQPVYDDKAVVAVDPAIAEPTRAAISEEAAAEVNEASKDADNTSDEGTDSAPNKAVAEDPASGNDNPDLLAQETKDALDAGKEPTTAAEKKAARKRK